jgi:hypothetical protein
MVFHEHAPPPKLERRRTIKHAEQVNVAPRPAWMDTDVVDPAWMKAHAFTQDAKYHVDVEDPVEIILEPLQEHFLDVFHMSTVTDEKGGYRNKRGDLCPQEHERLGEMFSTLTMAIVGLVNDALEKFYRTGKVQKGFVKEDVGILMSDDVVEAQGTLSEPMTEFIKAMPRLIDDIITEATTSEDVDYSTLIRSVWQHWIVNVHQDSNVRDVEILAMGLEKCSHDEIVTALEKFGIAIPQDRKGIIHVG